MHPSNGELLLSAEPSDQGNGSQVRAHLASCASCAARLQALLADLEEVASSLQVLDGTTPAVDVRSVIERASRRGRALASAQISAHAATAERAPSAPPAPPSARPRALARAAVVAALLAIAGAAAALPGSPVRRWLARRGVGEGPDVPTPVQIAPARDEPAGVALPADGPLELILPETVVEGALTLVSTAEEMVRVRVSDPATGFSFGPGQLTLDTRAAVLELELASPPGLPRLVVRVGQRIVLERDQPFVPAMLPLGDTLRISLGRR